MSGNGNAVGAHGNPHGDGRANCCGHGACSPPVKPGEVPEPRPGALLATRIGILGLIGFVLFITVSFCTSVYFDRESAFRNALSCAEEVMNEVGMQHWLQNGTLLGATRIGRLVLWDADLDYGILDNDSAALAKLSRQLEERCFGYSAKVRRGGTNAALVVWRKCTNRLCAEFHLAKLEKRPKVTGSGEMEELIVTGSGESPATKMFPLEPCRVADVDSVCPNNAAFFLAQAYGSEWLTKPLTKLF